jgi:hypothetical protein
MASIATTHTTCNNNQKGEKESSKKLIQIIDESTNDNNDSSSVTDLIDDDDGPPPLFTECQQSIATKHIKATPTPTPTPSPTATATAADTNQNDHDEPSLMEQMMKDAIKAKKEKELKNNEKARKESKKVNFGLKKGFLNSTSKYNTNTRSNQHTKAKNQKRKEQHTKGKNNVIDNSDQVPDIIYELDKSGNMVPKIEDIPTIKPKKLQDNNTNKTNPLQFQEVQDAMNENSNMFNYLSNNQHEWNTPDLINQISNNKILSSNLNNPKFVAALEAFKCNPNEAMKRFQHHPDVIEFLKEFCKIMGNHFIVLGERQEEEKKKKTQEDNSSNNKLISEEHNLGPMAKEALRKEAERKEKGEKGWNESLTDSERIQLDFIMQDKELTSLLMDVDMQRIMNECSTQPGRMRMYMHDKYYAPKLHKLIQAGLLKVV